MKTSSRLRSNARSWNSLAGLFGLSARIMRAQERSNKEAWQTRAIQKKLELEELNIAYRANQILLQDLAIEEKKRKQGKTAPAFTPANYTTTGTAPTPRPGSVPVTPQPTQITLQLGSILVAPTGRWNITAISQTTITVTDGKNAHTYPRSTVVSDLRSGRIHLEG